MATTIQLQNTINWAQPFLNYAPLNIGANNEPALTSANTILQTILAPPFKWRWNRKQTTFTVTSGTQDYTQAIADFGFLEKASVIASGDKNYELKIEGALGPAAEQSRPEFIATHLDDDSGNITFRLMPTPEQSYTATIIYQVRPVLMTGLTSLWSPVPDYFEFIYNWGFLSLMQEYFGDGSRSRQIFVASLLSVAEGLSDTEKNLFIQSWLGDVRQAQNTQMESQLGVKARGF